MFSTPVSLTAAFDHSDGDEIPDGLEIELGLDPTTADSDGDLIGEPEWQPGMGRLGGALLFDGADDLIDTNATHALMFDVLDDLNQGRIVVPSDPDIAIRVGRALGTSQVNVTRMAETLSVCPALTLKAVRAAREADPGHAPVRSCRQAVRSR